MGSAETAHVSKFMYAKKKMFSITGHKMSFDIILFQEQFYRRSSSDAQ